MTIDTAKVPVRETHMTPYEILLWLPESRMWQPLGQVTVDSREAALEAGLALPECPAASERPALAAVPLRFWQPQIASPPPPPEGHEWQPFVPSSRSFEEFQASPEGQRVAEIAVEGMEVD